MADKEIERRERATHDARELAAVLKDAQRNEAFNNFIGVALASYMNGVKDACNSFKSAANQGFSGEYQNGAACVG
ncbi:MAG: hypothetical protein IKE46_07930 [Selenomonadaceae bacterium]|nr:hypothetical protein [Selenomonadaceae bacterium]MBR4384174.1 hypothetical protein [Selenomonadaceae bacterium]